MLRDWTASDKVNSISAHAERFFTRLIMKADDHGLYYGDAKKLKVFLFPLLEDVRESDLLRWLDECHKAGLIALYEVDSKRYLQIIDFGQRLRQKTAKFPMPADCGQLTDDCPPKRREEEEEEKRGEPRAQADVGLLNSNIFRQPKIPTKQQVWEAISNAGGSKEMAKSFYEKYEATGWFLNGSPIVNYTSLAQRFVSNWNQRETKSTETKQTAPPLRRL
jgi:hypothetical protein